MYLKQGSLVKGPGKLFAGVAFFHRCAELNTILSGIVNRCGSQRGLRALFRLHCCHSFACESLSRRLPFLFCTYTGFGLFFPHAWTPRAAYISFFRHAAVGIQKNPTSIRKYAVNGKHKLRILNRLPDQGGDSQFIRIFPLEALLLFGKCWMLLEEISSLK